MINIPYVVYTIYRPYRNSLLSILFLLFCFSIWNKDYRSTITLSKRKQSAYYVCVNRSFKFTFNFIHVIHIRKRIRVVKYFLKKKLIFISLKRSIKWSKKIFMSKHNCVAKCVKRETRFLETWPYKSSLSITPNEFHALTHLLFSFWHSERRESNRDFR